MSFKGAMGYAWPNPIASMTNLTLWDKIINVTFFDEAPDGTIRAAMMIRCDKRTKVPGFMQRALHVVSNGVNIGGYQILKSNVQLSFGQGGANKVDVISMQHGMKPSIRLSMTQLPESVCIQVNLAIDNISLDVDISKYTSMYIEAGYSMRHGMTSTQGFHVAIFSSYIEQPNPNGRTVFTGIVGNWLMRGLQAQPYRVFFSEWRGRRGTPLSIREFITIICSYLGIAYRFHGSEEIQKTYDIPLEMENIDDGEFWLASNGYQVLDWMCNIVHQMSYQIHRDHSTDLAQQEYTSVVGCFFYDNKLDVHVIGKAWTDEIRKIAVDMNRITSATLQGGQMFVEGPWNPMMQPGRLFYMRPTFFKGRMAPNVVVPDLIDQSNLYRAITIDVNFATVTDENRMRIMSVGAKISSYDEASQLRSKYKDDAGQPIPLEQYVQNEKDQAAKEQAAVLAGLRGEVWRDPDNDLFPYMVGKFWAPSKLALAEKSRTDYNFIAARKRFSDEHQLNNGRSEHVVVINLSGDEADAIKSIEGKSVEAGIGSTAETASDPVVPPAQTVVPGEPDIPGHLPGNPPPVQPTFPPANVPGGNYEDPARMAGMPDSPPAEIPTIAVTYVGGNPLHAMNLHNSNLSYMFLRLKELGVIANASWKEMYYNGPGGQFVVGLVTFLKIMSCILSYKEAKKINTPENPYNPIWLGSLAGMVESFNPPDPNRASRPVFPNYGGANYAGTKYILPKIMNGKDLKTLTVHYDKYFEAIQRLYAKAREATGQPAHQMEIDMITIRAIKGLNGTNWSLR